MSGKIQTQVRLSPPMREALENTAPEDVALDAWQHMPLSEKIRLVLERFLKQSGAKWEEPVYKRTGRPPNPKKAARSKRMAR